MVYNDRPTILIVDDEALHREFARGVLDAAGWQVVALDNAEDAVDLLATDIAPGLILMDLHLGGMSGADAVRAIRRGTGAAAAAPIVAYTTTRLAAPQWLRAYGFDDFLAKPCTPDELTRAAAQWRPDGAGKTLDRLAASFGAGEIDSLLARFAVLLEEALGAFHGTDLPGVAHRVAGIAGTLGFAATGRAWLALSEGDESAREPARRGARRALAAIAGRERPSHRSTSV